MADNDKPTAPPPDPSEQRADATTDDASKGPISKDSASKDSVSTDSVSKETASKDDVSNDTVTADSVTAAEREPAAKKSGFAAVVALLALLLALAALGLAGYQYQRGEARQAALQQSLSQLRADQASLSALRSELQRDLDAQQRQAARALEPLQRQLQEQGQRLISLRSQLEQMGKTDRSDWLLAEAEYLLRLANQRLLMGRDIKASAKLLASADAILIELDDSALHPVRAALAEESAALRTANEFDLEGRYLQLRAAAGQAAELQLYTAPGFEADAVDSPAVDERWGEIGASAQRAWHKLSSYIRIDKRSEEFKPLLSGEQESLLRLSLQLMFEQAQLALLAGNETLYRQSLQRARDWMTRYYRMDAKAEQLSGLLDELLAAPVHSEMPDLSRSLRALKQYIDGLRWSESTAGRSPR